MTTHTLKIRRVVCATCDGNGKVNLCGTQRWEPCPRCLAQGDVRWVFTPPSATRRITAPSAASSALL